jgi:hypothetical protein
MIRLLIDGVAQTFPRDWTASAALARLGHGDPREFGFRRKDGTWVGASRRLADVLNDGDELELARI